VLNPSCEPENIKLDQRSTKQAYAFAFVMQPVKMQGGTGSTVAPVAIRRVGRLQDAPE
jgi:kynurenine formamidase